VLINEQVYSFVPIPGAQQHKRPRRRYEEIERMYKCGWNGCEKAYGTLNHLNAHVTMQSHGQKRTPEGIASVFSYFGLALFGMRI
jgi:transcription factor CON7